MPWEWVAPVATATSGAIVGVAGIIATFKSGRRQTQTALDVAHRQMETALRVAREERNQRRLDEAYPPLLDVLVEGEQWLAAVRDFAWGPWVGEPQLEPPEPPESVVGLRTHSKISSVWSPQVAALVRVWGRGVDRVDWAARGLAACWEAGHERRVVWPDHDTLDEPLPTLYDVKSGRMSQPKFQATHLYAGLRAMRQVDPEIRDQVWREQIGDRDGSLRDEVLGRPEFTVLEKQTRSPESGG